MSHYKAILLDLWDTLAVIPELHALTARTRDTLGEDRYTKLREHFIKWHTSTQSQGELVDNLNEEVSLNPDEIAVINEFLEPKNYELFPETDDVLKALKSQNIKLILVTNSPPSSKKAFKNMGIAHYFDKIIFSCDIGILKPNKTIFLEALSGFDIELREALMVGDSLEKDVRGAIDAGLDGLLIDREDLIQYDNKISNLREILPMLNDFHK